MKKGQTVVEEVSGGLVPYVPVQLTAERQFFVELQLPKVLTTEVELGLAAETLVTARKIRKTLEGAKKDAQKPYKAELDKIDEDIGQMVTRCKEVEETLTKLVTAYRIEATRKANAEAAKLEQARRAQQAAARAAGQNPLSVPEVIAPPMPPSSLATTHGTLAVTRLAKWRVLDNTQIPYEYNGQVLWLLNESAIGKACREMGVERIGKGEPCPIPGIEFYVEETTKVG